MYAGISLDQAPPEDIPMRFFLSAPIFGILAGLMILIDGESLFISNWAVETIALTHLITLGWLTMIMIGAFYQMVPVLVGGTVPFIQTSRIVHSSLAAGIVFLVGGLYFYSEPAIIIAGMLLAPSLSIFIIQIIIALFQVKADRPTVLAMRISIFALAAAFMLGILFAGGHALLWELPENRIGMTGIHMTLGLFGWVGTLIMGVAFHVIPMFYMTPPFPGGGAAWILRLHLTSLILVTIALISGLEGIWILIAGVPGFAAMALFVSKLFTILSRRKRKIVETTILFWQTGLIILPLSLIILFTYQLASLNSLVFVFALLYIVGFAAAVTNGMLYRIVPFLVWWHRFSMHIGKMKVPLLKDICPDKNARKQWTSFLTALLVLLSGILAGGDVIIRAGGLLFVITSAQLLYNLISMLRIKSPANERNSGLFSSNP